MTCPGSIKLRDTLKGNIVERPNLTETTWNWIICGQPPGKDQNMGRTRGW